MKNDITLHLRAFPVTIRDNRTRETTEDIIVLGKAQLQACQLMEWSATELIERMYNRRGYFVLEVGKAHKFPHTIDLTAFYAGLEGGAQNG